MADDQLPVVVIGVGGIGGLTLEACLQSDPLRVVGVADRDAPTAERVGKQAGVPYYTDNRRLLAETRPAAAFLAVPPAGAPEIVAACAERGIHVWKELPLARNLSEGVEMTRRMDRAKLKLAVGTQRRFALGYQRARQMLGRIGRVLLARGHYLFNWGEPLRWRGDRSSAGGGALMELGYHPVDLMVWMFGLPEEVYGQCAAAGAGDLRSDEPRPVYDTDDTAGAILHYADDLVASVVTTRTSGPVSEELTLHGRNGSIRADSERCVLRDPDGNVRDRADDEPPPLKVFRRQVDAFAAAVAGGGTHYPCSALENLLNLAVIEAIYLSDRTRQPESPARLLRNLDLTVEHCLRDRPPAEMLDEPLADEPEPENADYPD